MGSNKTLWTLISGTTVLASGDVVGMQLEEAHDKLIKGINFYLPPSANSLAKFKQKTQVDENHVKFVTKLSKLLQLDELQAWDLLCVYLTYEYRGTTDTLRSQLGQDREVQILLVDIWYFHHSERLFLLKCLKHIVALWQDDSHENQEYYAGFLETYNADGVLKTNLISQLTKVMEEYPPGTETHGPYLTEACISSWKWFNLCEQIDILQIILIYMQSHSYTSNDFYTLLKLFQKHGFGVRSHYWHVVEKTEHLIKTVNHCQSLVLVFMMDITSLAQGIENTLWADADIKAKSDEIFLTMIIQKEHSLVALAWMLFQYLGNEQPSTLRQYKKLGEKAVLYKVLAFMDDIMKNPMIQTGTVSSLAAAIIYSVLDPVLSVFEHMKLGTEDDLKVLICDLMQQEPLAMETWRLGSESGIGAYHLSAIDNFPHDFLTLVDLSAAMASSGISPCRKVMDLMESLPFFKEPLDNVPGSKLESTRGSVWRLAVDHYPFPGSMDVVIPAGTQGHVSEWPQVTVQWRCNVNGWDVINGKVQALLLQMQNYGMGVLQGEAIHEVTRVANLVHRILDMLGGPSLISLWPIVDSLFMMSERLSQVPSRAPLDVLSGCMEVFACVARTQPGDTWRRLSQADMFPTLSSSFTSTLDPSQLFGDVYMRPGVIGNIKVGDEAARRTYPFTRAFLRFLLSTAQALEAAENPTLGCVMYVLREIFPLYRKWHYVDLKEQDEIGQLCLDLFHQLLSTTGGDKSGDPSKMGILVKVCVYSLLHAEASQTLLHLVETGDSLIRKLLEQQAALDFGQGGELMRVVQLSLSVLNRLLLLRDSVQAVTSKSPLETILISQPQGPARPHFILTIASYIFHRFNPKLPTLAVKLLKRFAKEFPMSLLACLGAEAEAIRDAFLSRLEAHTEDVYLKVALLEFLSVSVEMQPGLLQMFINIPQDAGNRKIECRCLDSVTDILQEDNEISENKALLCAALQFLQALWFGKRILPLAYLKRVPSFWTSVCRPLFEDPRQNSRASAYIFNILTLELYTYRREVDPDMDKAVSRFMSEPEGHLSKWCDHVLCSLSESGDKSVNDSVLQPMSTFDAYPPEIHLLTAWKNFLVVVAKTQESRLSTSQREKVLRTVVQALDLQLQRGADSQGVISVRLAELCTILMQEWKRGDAANRLQLPSLKDLFLQASATFDVLHPKAQAAILSIGICSLKGFKSTLGEEPSSLDSFISSTVTMVRQSMLAAPKLMLPTPKKVDSDGKSLTTKLTVSGGGSLRTQVLSVCFLHQLVLMEKYDQLWLGFFKENDIIGILVNVASVGLQLQKGVELVHSIMSLFVALATLPHTAEMLVQSRPNHFICLPLASIKEETEGSPNWTDTYVLCIVLYTQLLRQKKHFFLEESLMFSGVHGERMYRVLMRVRMDLRLQTIQTAVVVANYLDQMAVYQQEWRLQPNTVMPQLMHGVVNALYTCVSYLLRPNLLQVLVEKSLLPKGAPVPPPHPTTPGVDRNQRVRRLSSTSDLDAEGVTPQLAQTQSRLMDLLACCLCVLQRFSPPLPQLLGGDPCGGTDLAQFQPLLDIGFQTPTLDRVEVPCLTFGTLLAAVTVCLRMLTKGESASAPSESSPTLSHSRILTVMSQSLVLLLSQAMLYLMDPRLSPRDKQLVRRELGAELSSFSDTMRRYLQLGTKSPQHGSGSFKLPENEHAFVKLMGNIVEHVLK